MLQSPGPGLSGLSSEYMMENTGCVAGTFHTNQGSENKWDLMHYVLYCNVLLHCITRHLTALHSTANCIILNCTALHSKALQIASYCTTQHSTALHISSYCTGYCIVLHCTTLHCTALQYNAMHCSIMHLTELHCTARHGFKLECHTTLYCTALYRGVQCSAIQRQEMELRFQQDPQVTNWT